MTAATGTESEQDTAAAAEAAETEGLAAEQTAAGDGTEGEPAGAENLGDAGKKALDEMKEKWKAARERAKVAEDKLAAAAKPADSAEKPPDLEELRKQARDEATAEALNDRVLDKIEAKAARLFKDPEDAVLRLGKSVGEFIDDGKIDLSAIDDALGELLKKRPDFGIAQGETRRFQGGADGGARGSAGKPQVTEAELKTMTPDQIVKAQNEGRLTKLLSG